LIFTKRSSDFEKGEKEGGEMWLKRRREWSREAGVTHKVWQLTGK